VKATQREWEGQSVTAGQAVWASTDKSVAAAITAVMVVIVGTVSGSQLPKTNNVGSK